MGKTFSNGFQVNEAPWNIYLKQKKNQVFKLLPLKEEGGEWDKQLEIVLLEMRGLSELSPNDAAMAITIMTKLQGLYKEDNFLIYRKTVFEIMSLIEDLQVKGSGPKDGFK